MKVRHIITSTLTAVHTTGSMVQQETISVGTSTLVAAEFCQFSKTVLLSMNVLSYKGNGRGWTTRLIVYQNVYQCLVKFPAFGFAENSWRILFIF